MAETTIRRDGGEDLLSAFARLGGGTLRRR
jgi:hypothetical protein